MNRRHATVHRMSRAQVAVLAAVSALVPGSVRAGEITLKTLIERSSLVVRARPANPPSITTKIPVGPEGQQDRYTPYTRYQARYEVLEVLRQPAGSTTKAGDLLVVDTADLQRELRLHTGVYVFHQSFSQDVDEYAPGSSVDLSAEHLVFLTSSSSGQPMLTMQGATESLAQLARVKRIIAKLPPPRPSAGVGSIGRGLAPAQRR
jgi:hypothetical protein